MSLEETRVDRSGAAWRVVLDEVYPTDQADLWSACTEPDRLRRWMNPYAGDLRLGGTWRATTDDGVWGAGTVTACDAPNSFTTTWTADGEAETVLAVRLEPADGGTRLVLEHDGITSAYYVPGWVAYLEMLGAHLRDPERQDLGAAGFDDRFAALRGAYLPRAEAAGLPA